MEIKKFECLKCGNCCRQLVGEEQKHIDLKPPCFFGKGPIIILAMPKLTILDWEKNLFSKEHLTPMYIAFDMISNTSIVFNYTLNTTSCPLLNEDNLCSVYEKRPLSCKAFPHPYNRMETEHIPSNSYGLCKGEIRLEELNEMMGFKKIDNDRMILNNRILNKNLYLRYGNTRIYSLMLDAAVATLASILNKLQEERKINLASQGYDFKYLFKRIQNAKQIGISDFLARFGYNQISDLVSSEETLQNVKNTLESLN